MELVRLIDENFKSFKIGYFPSDISPLGEYHHYPPKGYTGIWYEPNKSTAWLGRKCWMIKECEGEHLLEQEMDKGIMPWDDDTLPMLVAGDREWDNYTLSGNIQPLSRGGPCGLVFRYVDSRHFYMFALTEGKYAVLYIKCEDELKILAKQEFIYDCDHRFKLLVTLKEQSILCDINGIRIFTLTDSMYASGKIALAAYNPVRFSSVSLDMDIQDYCRYKETKKALKLRFAMKRKYFPEPRLYKVIDLKDFGAARNIRYGDLSGKGGMELLFIQSMPCLNSEDESMISCMTAVDLDGRILWQIGEPAEGDGMISRDLPVQICDIDGDGFNEVIYCKDFKLIVADGRTGKTRYWTYTPLCLPHERFTISQNIIYERITADSIGLFDFSGIGRPTDILVKDRYNNLWVYDSKLRPLWNKHLNTGHFPLGMDLNGDGRDELIAGYSLLDSYGKLIWELKGMECHVDEIVVGKFDPENQKYQIAMAAGEDGFLLVDCNGRLLRQDRIGHAQRISVANYRPDLPGLEICVSTFWRNTGIIYLFDCKGNRLFSCEPGANGNMISPVNWTGDGRELILYSAGTKYGGLFDGYGDRVVCFPEDGHPELCCCAVNITGDGRDELLAWDSKRMYIYTQDDNPQKCRYMPVKNPLYNYSNYRGEFSFPAWKELI